MIKVGLTGNIGSGKTTVSKIFEVLGVPVYQADKEAKKMLKKEDVILQLAREFGQEIISANQIDRKKLASIVFTDKEKLHLLNSIIHPLVKADLHDWMVSMSDEPYIVQEAAILFESGFYKDFEKNIMVYCPDEMAIKRVIKRDGTSEEQVRQRMRNQWESHRKIDLSDYVIMNDESQLLIPQVLYIHEELTELGSR
ncbi:MAG: dephospho-CoA kinase [Bacteroidales bacterium]|nr:dephospho-CoA kinase [Bacteroidales bacterium]